MPRPIHFEIQCDDLDRARRFYEAVFGWEFQDWGHVTGSPYYGVITGPEGEPGINGGLQLRPAASPDAGHGSNAAVLTMGVEDFDATARRIEDAGGRVALPKTALTGMAWQGYFVDTEGNTFGIHQPDPDAA
jgi:predicted enzyme related to lactoylglutathione lyase